MKMGQLSPCEPKEHPQINDMAGVGTRTRSKTKMGPSPCERKEHPLLNDMVLKILFEYMNRKDLKECRLVCKKWCVLTLSFVRSNFNIKLNGNGAGNPRSVTDYVQVFKENILGMPFTQYTLGPFCTTEGAGQEFLNICGSTAKVVYLYQTDPPALEISVRKIAGRKVTRIFRKQQEPHLFTVEVEDISAILKAMPNMVVFGITNSIHSRSGGNVVKLFPEDSANKPTLNLLRKLLVCDDHKSTSDYCPTFIEEILSVAPNISDFVVRDFRLKSIEDLGRSRIGEVLKAMEKFERQSVIRNLNFVHGKIEHLECLRRLAEKGMELNNLDVLLSPQTQKDGSLEILPQLATLFQNSIQRLGVNEVCSSFIKLPHMPKLERLDFRISVDFDSKSINLKKLFPVLKELVLNYWDYKDGDEFEEFLPDSEPCPNVKFLHIGQVVFKIQTFDHILNIFPKLTKIDLDLKTDGAKILSKIMTQMTQLEELSVGGEIEGIESIDAILTGIPTQKIQELAHVVSELKEMPVQLRAETIRDWRTRSSHFPSVANLTNLKILNLSTTGRCDDGEGLLTRMTDVFAYFGLYSMKHINKLEIRNCEFTKATCQILTVEMGLGWGWSFMHGENSCDHIIPSVG